jgi:hypothetical protein
MFYNGKEIILESPLISKVAPKTAAIVLNFSDPILHKGFNLWMDNYYISPALAKFLNLCNTDCV